MRAHTVEDVIRSKASDELIAVPASATVADAVEVMAARHVGAVVIKTEDGLVGGGRGVYAERDAIGVLVAGIIGAVRGNGTVPTGVPALDALARQLEQEQGGQEGKDPVRESDSIGAGAHDGSCPPDFPA